MLPRPVRHVLFDLAGVLLDTEPLYTQAIAAVAGRFGKRYDWTIKSQCIGRGTIEAARIIVDALELPLSASELIDERDRTLVPLMATAAALPGARASACAGRAGRADGDRHQHRGGALRREGRLAPELAIAVRGCGVRRRSARRAPKPAPDIFLAAAASLGAEPATCLVFEDSPFGVDAALAAGMQVVALPDPAMDRARYQGAHLVLGGFAELPSLEALGL